MRICSLLPSATEIVFSVGLGQDLVGVSHTCDFPAQVLGIPVLTKSLRKPDNGSGATPVYGISEGGVSPSPSFALDDNLLRQLKPDLILTQDICEVCAIGSDTVFEVAGKALGYEPEYVTVRATGLDDILRNVEAIGLAGGSDNIARDAVAGLASRIDVVRAAVAGSDTEKRVLCVEWVEPLRACGLWTSESVAVAGGIPGLSEPGVRSRKVGWDEIEGFAPETILFMPCAYDMPRCFGELARISTRSEWASLPAVKAGEVYVFDGRVPSRHGPRAVDVLEAFAEILHLDRFTPQWRGPLYQRAA